jgi:hypothetical protein
MRGALALAIRSHGVHQKSCLCGDCFPDSWTRSCLGSSNGFGCILGWSGWSFKLSVSGAGAVLSVWVDTSKVERREAAAWAHLKFIYIGWRSAYLFQDSANERRSSTRIFRTVVSWSGIGQSIVLDACAPEQLAQWTGRGQMVSPWSLTPHLGHITPDMQRSCACPNFSYVTPQWFRHVRFHLKSSVSSPDPSRRDWGFEC